MPTLFDEAAEASVSAGQKIDQETSEGAGTKKRKRTKKKKKVVAATEEGKIKEPDSKKMKLEIEKSKQGVTDGNDKKRRKKKKKSVPNKSGAIQVEKISGFFEKGKNAEKQSKTDDLLQFSNERLKAYGVNPNQFKRKVKKEKFRNLLEKK